MKIIFMGTPDFSVPTLEALIDSKHEVVACYTQPDKPKGRGKKMQETPVKQVALKNGINVLQPRRIRNSESVEEFKSIEADIAVVIAYGQILPKEVLDHPKYGCLNIHASLLPSYRGAAPYQWAVINGEKETGITIMQMDEGMDTGDMLLKDKIQIAPDETAGSLHDRLMYLGGPLILEALDKLEKNMLSPEKQDDELATYAPMLKKEQGMIEWTKSAKEIEQLIRGLNPWPSAYTYLDEHLVKIWKASIDESNQQEKAGTIFIKDKELWVVCGQGALCIEELQLQGKKRMDAASFLNGHPIKEGSVFKISNKE